ncbi:MAG: phage portal protein [Sarcina sp.]
MKIFNPFKKFKESYKQYQYAKMLSGQSPVFSQFGDDIYANDIVKSATRVIASEFSKLQPKHIRQVSDDKQEVINSSITRLLRYSPNELMTTSEFLEKCVWLRQLNYNCFIYPAYEYVKDKKIYKGFYPLNPTNVDFIEDITGRLFIKFTFGSGKTHTMPYSEIIHWRKDFSFNEFMGGDRNGQVDNSDILKVLKINHNMIEGIDKAIKSSLSINGIFKVNTMLDDEKQEKARIAFEEKLRHSESGIIAMDLKGEYIPLQDKNLVVTDAGTLAFVQNKILNNIGVSLPIVTGDFTDEQYQAFYEKTLEPMIISLEQAFTKTLYSERELDMGNKVIFYPQKLLFTNTKNKIAVADILGNRGALTDNQLLALFGYPPFEDGDKRHMSLNFVNRDIADRYQLEKAAGKEVNKENE